MKTMVKSMFSVILLCLFCGALHAQTPQQKIWAAQTNQLNEQGQKEGFWVEYSGKWKYEIYYKNGVRDGIFKYYSPKGELASIGCYADGIETGIWYTFGYGGHLVYIQKDFSKNTYPSPAGWAPGVILPYKCYHISFHPNGVKESEGVLVWEGSPDSDISFEYGLWKFYDEKGQLIEEKMYE